MKEKINLLSRGIFEYETPEIITGVEDKLVLEAEQGMILRGRFDVSSINGLVIRGIIYSSTPKMTVTDRMIIGTDCSVGYAFDPGNMQPGDRTEGHFSLITNGGEMSIPFEVTVRLPMSRTSIGEIKDLYQFAELARSNWHEAVKIFRSPNFERVFLTSKKHEPVYENLIRSRNVNQAMEEFLCTIRRKQPVTVSIAQDEIRLEDVREAMSDRLVIEKHGWGYKKLMIRSEGSFLTVHKRELTTEDFLGSFYELEYVIHPEAFVAGNNYGRIILTSFGQEITIPVVCVRRERSEKVLARRSLKENLKSVLRHYMDWQMRHISEAQWIRLTREDVDGCLNNSDDPFYQLLEAHFALLTGDTQTAHDILDDKNGWQMRHDSVALYDYYLYLNAMMRGEESYSRFVLDTLMTDYTHQYDYWQILWLILNMSEKLTPSRRLAMIRDQYQKGARSPLLYLEAIKALELDPAGLREFTDFEVTLISWASRHDFLKPELLYRFAQICTYGKRSSELALRTLINQCEIYENKDILMAVCALLIRGHKTEYRYNRWYALGIESELHLTNIFEYYMYSLADPSPQLLPMGVLLYFNYDNHLPVDKKALIYAYVIRNRENLPSVFRDYDNIIKAFTYEQLKNGYINRNMVVLYHHYITPDRLNAQTAHYLPKILFKYQIDCTMPGIRGVIAAHREVEKDTYYPLTDGVAYVDIYMDEYTLIFIDRDDFRYIGSVDYTMTKLMDDSELVKECCRVNPDQPEILMNRSERAIKYQRVDDASIDIYKRTLALSGIRMDYQRRVLRNLTDYYYDHYQGETLEKYLLRLDIGLMDGKERAGIIEYYIQRGLYEKAGDAVRRYGYESIQDKVLMRLCSREIRSMDYKEDERIVRMAWSCFEDGKYDDVILEYLIRYYNGTSADLLAVWKAAGDFEVNAYDLEERLLAQMLFSESLLDHGVAIFASYYRSHPDARLVRAFLAAYAYRYLVWDVPLEDARFFDFLEIELEQLAASGDVCILALLKYYAANPEAGSGHESWICQEVMRLLSRKIIMPFFAAFADIPGLSAELLDVTYIRYRTNPKHTVTLVYERHKTDEKPGSFVIEDMNNMFGGIFVKTLRLFSDEVLSYHINEKNGYTESVTEGQTVAGRAHKPDQDTPEDGLEWMEAILCSDREDDREQVGETVLKEKTLRTFAETAFEIRR